MGIAARERRGAAQRPATSATTTASTRNGAVESTTDSTDRGVRPGASCTRPAMLVDTVERLIIDYYTRLELPADVVLRLRATLTHHFDGLIASAQQELQELTDRRRRLEAEQDQLLDAHLAGAVPVAVLQRHQGRIEAELAAITQRLQDQYGDYEATRECLGQALDLLSDAHKLYLAGDDQTRRLCNQAFFTKIYIDEDGEIRTDLARPYNMLLDPVVHTQARRWVEDPDSYRGPAQTCDTQDSRVACSNFDNWVQLRQQWENLAPSGRGGPDDRTVRGWIDAARGGRRVWCASCDRQPQLEEGRGAATSRWAG